MARAEMYRLITCTLFVYLLSEVPCLFAQTTGVPLTRVEDGFYYFEKTNTRNWFDADRFCRSHGLALVALETRNEQIALNRELLKQGLAQNDWFWTSGTDLGSEGNFYWSQTGEDLLSTFTYWYEREPNNANNNENCMAAKNFGSSSNVSPPVDIRWNDDSCMKKGQFVCELPQYCWGYDPQDLFIQGEI